MDFQQVLAAIESKGSVNGAAKLLAVNPATLALWLARNGYEVVHAVTLRPLVALTDAGREAAAAVEPGFNLSDTAVRNG